MHDTAGGSQRRGCTCRRKSECKQTSADYRTHYHHQVVMSCVAAGRWSRSLITTSLHALDGHAHNTCVALLACVHNQHAPGPEPTGRGPLVTIRAVSHVIARVSWLPDGMLNMQTCSTGTQTVHSRQHQHAASRPASAQPQLAAGGPDTVDGSAGTAQHVGHSRTTATRHCCFCCFRAKTRSSS